MHSSVVGHRWTSKVSALADDKNSEFSKNFESFPIFMVSLGEVKFDLF